MTLDRLNQEFSIPGQVVFQTGKGGLTKIAVTNQFATAEVYLLGAHVTDFQPRGKVPVLWMSDQAQFEEGQAIRGGIPIIWPWFGSHPSDVNQPAHGFVRTMLWQVAKTESLADGQTRIALSLNDNTHTQSMWPHAFALQVQITVGKQLQVDLISRNMGDAVLNGLEAALHTYFNIGDIEQIEIQGLANRDYLDKVTDFTRKTQQGVITFGSEVDRIYLDTTASCLIHDTNLQRTVQVDKAGSQSTVVWNPWANKAQAMADFPDEGYRTMVCVETAKAVNDLYDLDPDESQTLTQVVSVV